MFRTVWQRLSRFPKELTLSEISGALGDLGTFLPLLLGLVQVVGLDLGTTLVATGIYNVITGLQFGIPMPVQPMKTISAEALSGDPLSIPEIAVAGFGVSLIVMLLGATGLMNAFNNLVPLSLVRGIQLGVGLRLAIKGLTLALYMDASKRDWRQWWGPEGLVLGVFSLIFILVTTMPTEPSVRLESDDLKKDKRVEDCPGGSNEGSANEDLKVVADLTTGEFEQKELDVEAQGAKTLPETNTNSPPPCCGSSGTVKRTPSALILVVLGLILTISFHPDVLKQLAIGPSKVEIVVPTWEEVKTGLIRGALPQLPLTTLNSVVAVCKLSSDLFPEMPASPDAVASSVGLMNIVGCWFGVMPCCHGAGGLAAQAKFGARTGTAPVFLGLVKIVLGLVFGSSLFSMLQKFPEPLLGGMLVFSGVELAGCCRSETGARGVGLMLITAIGCFATANTGIGFGIGAGCFAALKSWDFVSNSYAKWRGH